MAEFHANVYVKPPKSVELKHFQSLLNSELETDFWEAAILLNPKHGRDLAEKLLESLVDFLDIHPEGFEKYGPVFGVRYVLGIQAEQMLDRLLLFYEQLINPVDLRAYMSGDDDPWEIFYKVDGSKLIKEQCVPDESDPEEIIQTAYAWWHQGLPKSIFEGQLIFSRAEVPAPIKPVKSLTKTKISVPDGIYWEMMFFNMLPDKNETPENDDINSYWEYSWEGSEDQYQQVMLAFQRLRIDYARYDVNLKKHAGSGCDISYNFSESSNNDSYALIYASFSALIGADIKQFVTEYPDFDKHYVCADESVTVEIRQGKKVTSSETHSIKDILSESN